MRRFFAAIALCALMAIGATSCKKQGGEVLPAATEKGRIRIEKFEGIERGKGLSGDVLLSVSNGLRSNITLINGQMEINFGDKKIGSLTLTDEVTLPKRVISSVKVPVSLQFTSPIVAYGLLAKLMRGELNKMTVTIDAEAKVGAVRRRIYKENISLHEALQSLGIPTDRLKALVK
ncbi:MAG: hypothetical protein E7130_00045 [Rikenellaceae bacterium]|nr:hypothetical protein [Rikenellaceae bacterium]